MIKFLLLTQVGGQKVAINTARILSITPKHPSSTAEYNTVISIETGGQDWYGAVETFDEVIEALNKAN